MLQPGKYKLFFFQIKHRVRPDLDRKIVMDKKDSKWKGFFEAEVNIEKSEGMPDVWCFTTPFDNEEYRFFLKDIANVITIPYREDLAHKAENRPQEEPTSERYPH